MFEYLSQYHHPRVTLEGFQSAKTGFSDLLRSSMGFPRYFTFVFLDFLFLRFYNKKITKNGLPPTATGDS
jgi:hypothetical protein